MKYIILAIALSACEAELTAPEIKIAKPEVESCWTENFDCQNAGNIIGYDYIQCINPKTTSKPEPSGAYIATPTTANQTTKLVSNAIREFYDIKTAFWPFVEWHTQKNANHNIKSNHGHGEELYVMTDFSDENRLGPSTYIRMSRGQNVDDILRCK